MKKGLVVFLVVMAFFVKGFGQSAGVQRMLHQASIYFVAGKYEDALKLLKEAYSQYPDPNILWNIGRCYEEMWDYEDALRAFKIYASMVKDPHSIKTAKDKIKTLTKKWADQLAIDGERYEAEGRLIDAYQAYDKAYSLVKKPELLWKMAMIRKKRKEYELAIAMLNRYIKAKPGIDEVAAAKQEIAAIKVALQEKRIKQARSLAAQGQYVSAMELLKSAYLLRQDPSVQLEIGLLYEKMGKKNKALGIYKRLLNVGDKRIRASAQQRIDILTGKKVAVGGGSNKGKILKISGYIVGGVAVALLVTGGVMWGLSSKDFNKLDSLNRDDQGRIIGMSQKDAADLRDKAERYQKIAGWTIGSGAVCAVVSGVLYWQGIKHTRVVAHILHNNGFVFGLGGDF